MVAIVLCPMAGVAQQPVPAAGGWRTAWSYDGPKGPDHWGSLDPDYAAVRVNYPPGNGNYLIVGNTRYELTQFHFHHPSEEYVHAKPSATAVPLKSSRLSPTTVR